MALPVHQRFSFEDYLALEETSTVKHEFSDGHVWAMAGGTPDHGALAANGDYDRGEKLAHYKQIPSLDEVVLVAHEEPRLELWRRESDYWTLHVSRGEETASVASLGRELSLADVYRNPLPGSD
jgi:Uma2 family endonuclease